MKDLEQLVQYLDGELNELEKQQLVEKLKNDPSLSEKLDLIKDVDKLIGDKQLERFEESLREVEANYFNSKNEHYPLRKRKVNLQIAAVAIILISAASYFIFVKEGMIGGGNDLFSEYYEKLPANFMTRSELNTHDGFISAINLYNENKYNEAINEFNKIIAADPNNNAAKLFLGICYIETRKFNDAEVQFKYIISKKDPIFEEHAAWYLSLCYIKTQTPEQAKPLLNKLVNSQSFYKVKASELLSSLH